MNNTNLGDTTENRRMLVNHVAASRYLSRSSRLREMFLYVSEKVLNGSTEEIHEQEVGQEVFGRPADYDTATDNTVRVHASMLRKRIHEYFENEGSRETLIIEIPRGNYAPVFRERPVKRVEPSPALDPVPTPAIAAPKRSGFGAWLPSILAVFFGIVSLALYWQVRTMRASESLLSPTPGVSELWSQIFPRGKQTDVVLGDASLGTLQEQTAQPVPLSEYFDRSYLNTVGSRVNNVTAPHKLDSEFAKAFILKRQVNYSDVALLARLSDMAHTVRSDTKVRFARDYSFRELKANNAILFGNLSSNPWLEPFRNRETLRWKYDSQIGSYFPLDTTAALAEQDKFRASSLPDGSREGYATLSLLPNLSGTGNVLILSATGGTAINAALDFLCDPRSVAELRSKLVPNSAVSTPLPYFEVLIRATGRNGLSRAATSILIIRRISA